MYGRYVHVICSVGIYIYITYVVVYVEAVKFVLHDAGQQGLLRAVFFVHMPACLYGRHNILWFVC